MKKKLISTTVLCILCLIGIGVQVSEAAFFDFDNLPYPGDSSDIESYMEDIYGSDITVANAVVGDGIGEGPLGPDHYIQSSLSLGYDWFEISFNEVPINEVSFEWGSTLNRFIAEADGVVILDTGIVGYDYGIFSTVFENPVTTLMFHDSFLGEVGIDNLDVTPVPLPAAVWFLGSGLIGLAGVRRKSGKR